MDDVTVDMTTVGGRNGVGDSGVESVIEDHYPLLRLKDIYFAAFLRTQGYAVTDIRRGFHALFTFEHVDRELVTDYYNGREFGVSPKLLFTMFQDLRRMSRQVDDGSEAMKSAIDG